MPDPDLHQLLTDLARTRPAGDPTGARPQVARRARRLRRRRRLGAAGALVVAAALAAAVVGLTTGPPATRIDVTAPTTAAPATTAPATSRPGGSAQPAGARLRATTASFGVSATISTGYGPIGQLVGSPSGGGVWFWSSTKSVDTIFFESTTGALKSWNVLTGSSYQAPEYTSGLAVSSSGDVWFGVNRTLVELDPSTGATQTWTIPVPASDDLDNPYIPTDIRDEHAVSTLTAGPDGTVAIAMDNTNSVILFDSASGTFSSLSLPSPNDEALSVAYSVGGTLGVGTSDPLAGGKADSIALYSSAGAVPITATLGAGGSAWDLTAGASGGFIAGATSPVTVSDNGTVSVLNVPRDLTQGEFPSPLMLLPGGMMAGLANGGVAEFPRDASSVAAATADGTLLSVRDTDCRASESSPTSCGVLAFGAVAADEHGNIWVVNGAAQVATVVGRMVG